MLGRRALRAFSAGVLVAAASAGVGVAHADTDSCVLTAGGATTAQGDVGAAVVLDCDRVVPGRPGEPGDLHWWSERCGAEVAGGYVVVVSDDHVSGVFAGDFIATTFAPIAGPFGEIEQLVSIVASGGQFEDGSVISVSSTAALDSGRRFSSTRQWAVSKCFVGLDGAGRRPGSPGFDPNDPSPGLGLTSVSALFPTGDEEATLQEMIDSAYALLDPPDPPAFSHSPTGPSVTQLPTIMWIDEPYWIPRSQRDGFDFPFTFVEVTAVPLDWVFSAGDGGVSQCEGRGLEWVLGMEPGGEGVCHYAYENASTGETGGVFETNTEVRFVTAWQTNIPGYGVTPLPPVFRATDEPHQVEEVLGIVAG